MIAGYDLGKLATMIDWCERNKVNLETQGEVGFGRPCVGVISGSSYVQYDYDLGLEIPEDAYHKDDCLAVLVFDEDYHKALDQLYEWIVSIIEQDLKIERSIRKTWNEPGTAGATLEMLMSGTTQAKLVRA